MARRKKRGEKDYVCKAEKGRGKGFRRERKIGKRRKG